MRLSEWLAKTDEDKVGEGVAEIGPDAIPFLARNLKPPHPRWNDVYTRVWKSLPQKIRTRLPWPHREEKIRQSALFALKEFGDEARSVLSDVIHSARHDPSVFCRTFAMNAAIAIGHDDPAVASLFAELLRGDRSSKNSAALAPYNAAQFPSNCLSHFLPILAETNEPPFNALMGVGVLGPGASEAVPLIVEALKDPQLRGNALSAIQRIGPAAESAIPVLTLLIDSAKPASLVPTCEALMNIGAKASNAIPSLRRLMMHEDVLVRILAAAAVARINGDTTEAIPVLLAGSNRDQNSDSSWRAPVRRFGLDHYAFNSRMTAVWLLGELAPHSIHVLPMLKSTVVDCPDWLAPVLARSIWKLEGRLEAVLPLLRASLKSGGLQSRVLACTTIAEIGPSAREALPDLEAILKRDLNTRQAARFAIRAISASPAQRN